MQNTSKNIPQYKKLYELLRKQIINGIYEEGTTLPSENELSNIHSLTRPTVRRALDALVYEGYINKHQGKGSIVKNATKDIGILSITGTTSAVGEKKLKTRIITKPQIQPWPEPFTFPLSEYEKETNCIIIERIRLVEDEPIFFDTNYIPAINLPGFISNTFENKSLFTFLRNYYHIEITGGLQRLRSLCPTQKIARFLELSPDHPVLHLERKLATNKPNFNIYSSLYCNTEKYTISGTF